MIKVALFEDNILLREQLEMFLNTAEGVQCVGGWENCLQVEKIMQFHQPDVVLMDIDMPEANGFYGLRAIIKNQPHVPVIMLTVFEDDQNVFESICLGAKGYMLKKSAPEKIVDAIKDVMDGGSPMSPFIARKVLENFSAIKNMPNPDYHLTNREKDILRSLVSGNSYKMIGADLSISINTVRQYIRKVYEKLQVNSMNEAVAKAIKQKII
ncbi:response regulator [Niabella aquatica]